MLYDRRPPADRLTPREMEVLRLLLGGHSNKGVGLALGISPRTVEVHRLRCREKLQAATTAELAVTALAAGVQPRRLEGGQVK